MVVVLFLFPHLSVGSNCFLYGYKDVTSTSLTHLAQDHYGYIWSGSLFGLNKFDGYRFRLYLRDKDNAESLPSNSITSLFCDRHGRMWVGTNVGLCYYDYHRDGFVRMENPSSHPLFVRTVYQTSDGSILIGSFQGVMKVNVEKRRIEKLSGKDVSTDIVLCLEELSRGTIVAGKNNSSIVIASLTGNNLKVRKTLWTKKGSVRSLIRGKGNVLLAVCSGGVEVINTKTWKMTDANIDMAFLSNGNTIRSGHSMKNGNILVGTTMAGAFVYNPETGAVSGVKSDIDGFSLSSSDVADVLEDKDGNIWAACYNKGLFMRNNSLESFRFWGLESVNQDIGTAVTSVVPLDDGGALCAVANKGIFRFLSDGKVTEMPAVPGGSNSILRTRSGVYYIADSRSLYVYNVLSGAYVKVTEISGIYISALAEMLNGDIVIGTYGSGVYVYSPSSGSSSCRYVDLHASSSLHLYEFVRSLLVADDGILYVGTPGGVVLYDLNRNQPIDAPELRSLKEKVVLMLFQRKNGNVIIVTNDDTYVYDRKKRSLHIMTEIQQMGGAQVCGIVEDQEKDLWISTTSGIWRLGFDGKLGNVSAQSNVSNREYNLGSAFMGKSGQIFFGTPDGVVWFDPYSVEQQSHDLGKVLLAELFINGERQDPFNTHISIPSGSTSCMLAFSLMSFQNMDNVVYEYRTNGGQWRQITHGQNTITFYNVSPGSYRFEVRATCAGSVSGISVYHIKVEWPWYLSWWAVLLYAIAFALVAYYAYVLVRDRNIRREKREKINLLVEATNDLRSPLSLIVGPLGRLKEMTKDSVAAEYLETIERNARRLTYVLSQILDQHKLNDNQVHIICRNTDLCAMLRNIMKRFDYTSQKCKVDVSLMLPRHACWVWIDHVYIERTVNMLFDYAFRYTPDGGRIDVTLEEKDDSFKLCVADTGIGISQDNLHNLFDTFRESSTQRGMITGGTRMGLSLSRSIIQMHGGSFSVESSTGKDHGTRVFITLRKGKDHLQENQISNVKSHLPSNRLKGQTKLVKVLVSGQDFDMVRYIADELSECYSTSLYLSRDEAFEALLHEKYDIVVVSDNEDSVPGDPLLKIIRSNPATADILVVQLKEDVRTDSLINSMNGGADAFVTSPFSPDEIVATIEGLLRRSHHQKGGEVLRRMMEEGLDMPQIENYNDEVLTRVTSIINEHLSEPDFNVERLCELAGISRTSLHRRMKDTIDVSTADYIRNCRLAQAAKMLSNADTNVSDVAYAVGFQNLAHFSTTFKKYYGMTPSEFVKKKEE